ncbi:MAG: nucleotidyltransferase domain-containing protein [Acidobacteria bacterium]|jgi:predicted nucleotidyltransferase|nr:nucleotidyltransferase domain-containing protein [Acidobacteriota bacterium]
MAEKVPKRIQKILAETKKELEKTYSHRLKDMILFGSYARGDYSRGSDIDILMLLDKSHDLIAERSIYLPITSRLSLKYDTVISIIPIPAADFRKKKTPLLLNVRKEGIRL